MIAECAGGLGGCPETVFNEGTIDGGSGTVLDKHDNLILCDQDSGVLVIDPPYTSITRELGSSIPFAPINVTLDKENNLAFVVAIDDALGSGFGTYVYVLTIRAAVLSRR